MQISWQSAREGGKVVSPMHQPPLPPRNIPGTHFCYRPSQPRGHSAAGRTMSMKNSNDTIGNQTRDLPACSTVHHGIPLDGSAQDYLKGNNTIQKQLTITPTVTS